MPPRAKLIIPPNYGDQILSYRKSNKLYQKELAALIGVGPSAVNKWEKYKAVPTRNNWLALVNLMNTELASLPQPVQQVEAQATHRVPSPNLPYIPWKRLIPPRHVLMPLLYGMSLGAAASAGAFIATKILHLC